MNWNTLLPKVRPELAKIEIKINDKIYRLTTKLKFANKLAEKYNQDKIDKIVARNKLAGIKTESFMFDDYENFLSIIHNNLKFGLTLADSFTNVTEVNYSNALIRLVDSFFETVDINVISMIIWSMVDDDSLTFEEFQDVDILELITNIHTVIKSLIESIDISNVDKKKVAPKARKTAQTLKK